MTSVTIRPDISRNNLETIQNARIEARLGTTVYTTAALGPGFFRTSGDWRTCMHWLWVVLIGLVVGALAKFIMPGKDPGGFIVTILIGIAGSLVATWLGRAIGLYQEGQSAGFIMSVVGAIVLLGIYHLVRPKTA
jgi:uncharacterized membrane protein YeaQ/YmgE (transglycosylase-associated protein family)